MLPGDKIIARPLTLFIYDFPAVTIPFAIIPNKGGERKSGWIMPQFGEDDSRTDLVFVTVIICILIVYTPKLV